MSTRRRVLVVFVDALGPAQLAVSGGAFDAFPHRASLRGVFGYSSGALPTILTGATPAVHGRMCLFSARSRAEPSVLAPLSWIGLLPHWLHERQALRRRVARWFASAHGWTGYFALHRVPPGAFRWLDVPEREDLFQADAIGGARTFLADARAAGLRVYASPWQLGETDRSAHALDTLAREPVDLAFLYCAELDAVLHRDGNAGESAHAVLTRIGTTIRRARELLGRDGADVVTWIVGDHGMADVHTTIDPRPALSGTGAERVFVDSTLVRVWGDLPIRTRVRSALEKARIPGTWLERRPLLERDAPVDGAPFGDAMFVLPEGALFVPSYVGGRVKGMHGYDLGTPSTLAGIASDAEIPPTLHSLTDIARSVRDALGLP